MEAAVRFGVFVGLFAALALLEAWRPRRRLSQLKRRRWPINLGITVLDTLLLRLTLGAAAVSAALWAEAHGIGLLHLIDGPAWAEAAVALLVLDFGIYLQHVATHVVPALWRLHQVHHADLDIDVTTGLRFHPVEILLSMLWKVALVVALGAPAWAVVTFEILLNAGSVFSHANARLPGRLDRVLRWLVVTPDMHRVHHSTIRAETDSNFGFFLPWWDRLCGTYRAQPKAGHEGMEIGLAVHRDPDRLGFLDLLLMPFRPQSGPQSGGSPRLAAEPDRRL